MTEQEDYSLAVARARDGAEAWTDVVRYQRGAVPDHTDLYALAGELVQTLYALQDLAVVLRGQVAGYAAGRAVYDDCHQVDPARRLAEAAGLLALTRDALGVAGQRASGFWSAIGHIGVEVPS
ncbi:hypothetical protein [Pseudonocardia acidicola]|uniref:hypothetical protein n=1 Tax=Pseudonocardia acidicola TaxID=2724939 RepID=UPI001EF152F1|nr:hypothetical protein [Pseudonocardia acidicola]